MGAPARLGHKKPKLLGLRLACAPQAIFFCFVSRCALPTMANNILSTGLQTLTTIMIVGKTGRIHVSTPFHLKINSNHY